MKTSTCIAFALLAGLVATTPPFSLAGITSEDNNMVYSNVPMLERTFASHQKVQALVDFGLTREDMLSLFAHGNDIEIFLSPVDSVYAMNIGFTDLVQPQTWTLPAIAYGGPSHWRITEPTQTPHVGRFPTATHTLVSEDDQVAEGKVYLYYAFTEQELVLLGEAVEPPDNAPLELFTYGIPLALFPLDETMQYEVNAEGELDGVTVTETQVIEMTGFGMLDLGTGESVKASVFINDIVWQEIGVTDPDSLYDFETHYSIFAEDGTQFSFYIADPPDGSDLVPIEGDVFIEEVELWRVVQNTSTAVETDETLMTQYALSSAYPNPFNPQTNLTLQVQQTQVVSIGVFDVLGRQVDMLHEGELGAQATHRFTFDASHLPSGLYVVQVTGESFRANQTVSLVK